MAYSFNWIPTFSSTHTHHHYAGKLLLQQELREEADPHVFKAVPSIERRGPFKRCRRCGNTKAYLFGYMPHHSCKKDCLYCRNCIQMGRVLECEPLYVGNANVEWPEHTDPCAWKGNLTPYQQRAAAEIVSVIEKGKGELLVWAVCGAGKTEMLFPGLIWALTHGKRVCLATPRVDVVRELYPRLHQAFPDVRIQALYGDSEDKIATAPFILATTHQLLRFVHAFDVLIIDEIDAFPFHNDPSLHFAAKRAAKPHASILYLTATPRRKERRRIRKKDLSVVFIPRRFHGHPLPVPKLKLTPTLSRYLKKGTFPHRIVKEIHQTKRQLLIFLPTIKQTEQMGHWLRKQGIPCDEVFSSDPDRVAKIEAFRKKDISILLTTTILERGVTFPSVDVFVIDAGHTVFDEAALVQIAGRAGRSHDDPTGEVLFFHDGKTNAIMDACEAILAMNRKGAKS